MSDSVGSTIGDQLSLLYTTIKDKIGSLPQSQQSALKYTILTGGGGFALYSLYKFATKKEKGQVDGKLLKRLKFLLSITVPSVKSTSFLQMVALAFVVVCRTFISNRLSTLSGEISRAMLEYNSEAFIQQLGVSTTTSIFSAILAPTLTYLIDKSAIEWRTSLTRYVHNEYLDNMMYYKTSNLDNPISNPDAIVTQDIQKWCEGMCGLFASLIKPFADLLLYTTKLVEMTGWIGPISIVSYMVSSWVFISFIRPKFSELTSKTQSLEGDFRYGHVRATTNGESIAFYGGDDLEKEFAESSFDKLYKHKMMVESVKGKFEFFNELFVVDFPQSMCWIVSSLPVFYGGLADKGQGVLARDLRYLAAVITHEFSALGELVKLTNRFSEITGYTNNICDLLDKVKDYKTKETKSNIIEGETIKFEGVDLVTPSGVTLIKDLNLEIEPGKNYLIVGPNGVGKSSLFRIVQGLWPLTKGKIEKPDGKIYYVPQKPYNCTGTLRQQITYPKQDIDPKDCTDEYLTSLMKMVDIEKIVHRYGFSTVTNWDDNLSLGEQQRLSMARLFFHKPRFCILDECTNAISVDIERQLYEKCKDLGITIITISLRPALKAYHDYELKIEGNDYSIHKIEKDEDDEL